MCTVDWHSTVLSLTCHLDNEVISLTQSYLSQQCFPPHFFYNNVINLSSGFIFHGPVSFGRTSTPNVIPLKWNSCSISNSSASSCIYVFFLFARLTWRGKTRPVGSLSTCAAWEKETGLGRKHFRGKTACNNAAVFNLNPVLSRCLCHPPPIWLHLQHVFNIPTRTRVHPFIVCTVYITCPFDNVQLLSCTRVTCNSLCMRPR